MRTFMLKLDEAGQESLGTFGFINLDGRHSKDKQLAQAAYHASARNWPGYVVYTAPHLREKWIEVFRKQPQGASHA